MFSTLAKKLAAPYPCDFSVWSALKIGFLSGVFVFIFFAFLQPFGLAVLSSPVRWTIYGGYGLLCMILIAVNSLVGPRLRPGWFREEAWTTGKHILFAVWIVLTIGLACFFFTRHVFKSQGISLEGLHIWIVLGGALAVGAVPITIMTLLDEIMLLRRSDRAALEANVRIDAPHGRAPAAPGPPRDVRLVADNGRDAVQIAADALLYISAEENYVTVHARAGAAEGTLLRSSLTRVEKQLGDLKPVFFRCHRAYIVNTAKIRKVTGNALGLKLTLEGGAGPVPVARRYVEEFRRVVVPRL